MPYNILEYLEQTVQRVPEKAAICGEGTTLTFLDLYTQARSIGTRMILDRYYKQPVVVFMKKSPATIAAFLGVIYSGCFYVPLDADMCSSGGSPGKSILLRRCPGKWKLW